MELSRSLLITDDKNVLFLTVVFIVVFYGSYFCTLWKEGRKEMFGKLQLLNSFTYYLFDSQ